MHGFSQLDLVCRLGFERSPALGVWTSLNGVASLAPTAHGGKVGVSSQPNRALQSCVQFLLDSRADSTETANDLASLYSE